MEDLTKSIQEYLGTPDSERDIEQGALLLLRINRNRILYNNIVRNPRRFAQKLENELKKHLQIKVDGLTLRQVADMAPVVTKSAAEILEAQPVISTDVEIKDGQKVIGKRADHDQLPAEIQKLWDDNAKAWGGIKDIFNQLKTMESAPPCDRYELLKILDEKDKQYRHNFELYDNFVIGITPTPSDSQPEDVGEIIRKIGSARTYITQNRPKLTALLAEDPINEEKVSALRSKIQERVDYLVEHDCSIEAQSVADLKELGINFPADGEEAKAE